MSDRDSITHDDTVDALISRRSLLRSLGIVIAGAPFAAVPLADALAQGKCRLKLGSIPCDTTAIKPIFGSTGWKTTSLDHISMQVADIPKEIAFYSALMGWTLRSDDGKQAIMDYGTLGSVVFKQLTPAPPPDTSGGRGGGGGGGGGGRGGRGGPARALVEGVCWGITPWDAKKVEAELKKRGLTPVADNDGHGFESFHVKDPDGFDVQISNGAGARARTKAASTTLAGPAPFESTGWKTVWLDHLSFSVTNYKESCSFYSNLFGWTPTYDEGSQIEYMMADVGDIIIRGGNPLDPAFGRGGRAGGAGTTDAPAQPAPRRARIDHISFGISPWDTDGVKDALLKRGLRAQPDTSTDDEIHVSEFKSYHTSTPNGYELQISAVHKDTRLTLPNAVRPRKPA